MPNIWVPNKEVHCPLCDQPFSKRRINYKGNMVVAYFCREDDVMIFGFDPMFDKWRDTDKEIPCPNCNTPMKWFGRMLDCYTKCECPACGICVQKDSNMTRHADGSVEVEDMDDEQPEVFDLQIPIDKLNLTPDKKAQLRQKIQRKREHDAN